jgi:hypothetical protein
MPREEFETEEYMAAVGVDRHTGTFVQVWKQPHQEQDGAALIIDNRGVLVYDKEVVDGFPPAALAYLDGITARYEYARDGGNNAPNIDAETVGTFLSRMGFPSLTMKIYKIFD